MLDQVLAETEFSTLDATTVLANMEPDIAHQIKSVSKADRDALLMKCAGVECDHLPEHYEAVCPNLVAAAD